MFFGKVHKNFWLSLSLWLQTSFIFAASLFSDFVPNLDLIKNAEYIAEAPLDMTDLTHISRSVKSGVFIGNEGEKSFKLAALAMELNSVVIVSQKPGEYIYSRIQAQLLKAKNLSKYRHLRWESDYQAWLRSIPNSKLSEEDFIWWLKNVRNTSQFYDDEGLFSEMLSRFNRDLWFERIIRVQTALLRVTKNESKLIQDKFRLKASYFELKKMAKRKSIALDLREEEYDWWLNLVNLGASCLSGVKRNFSNSLDLKGLVDYKTGNYLFSEKLFQHLSALAKAKKIHLAYLNGDDSIEEFSSVIDDLDGNITYVALSDDRAYSIFSGIKDSLSNDTLILGQKMYMQYGCLNREAFIGLQGQFILNHGYNLSTYFKSLPPEIFSIISGRIYSSRQLPPYWRSYLFHKPNSPVRYFR